MGEKNKIHKDIRAIIRGHLISVDKKFIELNKYGKELIRTKFYAITINENMVSFKQRKNLTEIKFDNVNSFSLLDSNTFVFKIIGEKKKLFFKIV